MIPTEKIIIKGLNTVLVLLFCIIHNFGPFVSFFFLKWQILFTSEKMQGALRPRINKQRRNTKTTPHIYGMLKPKDPYNSTQNNEAKLYDK